MKSRFSRMLFLVTIIAATLIVSCNTGLNPPEGTLQGALKFNLTGATAIGAADINASRGIKSAEDAFGLVKVLADGSIQMAMEVPEGVWMPRIKFIAKSPKSSDLFVAFDNDLNISYSDATGMWINESYGNFLHIKADGTYTTIKKNENNTWGSVKNYAWWGADDYKPVVFDDQGCLYFVYEGNSNGSNIQVLCKYDPVAQATTQLTAALEGYNYETIEISPDGSYLFVKGSRYSSTTSTNFFRVYSTSNRDDVAQIFYSSSGNVWVRGFKSSPDAKYLIMNGYNIRGINGIMKVAINSINDIDYTSVYNNNTSSWFQPVFSTWTDYSNKQWVNGLFTQYEGNSLRWVLTDGTKFLYATPYYLLDSANTSIYYEDPANSTSSSFNSSELGVNYYFASSSTDPTQKYLETSYAALLAADRVQVVKYSTWYYDYVTQTGGYKYVDVPAVVVSSYSKDNLGTICYYWNEYWFQNHSLSSGMLDSAAVSEYLSQFFVEDAEFNYNGKTGDAAYQDSTTVAFTTAQVLGTTSDAEHFLKANFKNPDTGSSPKTFNQFRTDAGLTWLDFSNVGNMFFDSTGSLWGVVSNSMWGATSKPIPIKLMNSSGKRDLQVINAFSGDEYMPVGFVMDGSYMYFRDALRDDLGQELGFHKIRRFSINDASPVIEDLLVNVPSNGKFEIVDYSIGGGFVYFTGVTLSGTIIGGKVNLTTLEFAPFDATYRLSNIEIY